VDETSTDTKGNEVSDIETRVEELTADLWNQLQGKDVQVVVGASLNLIMNALCYVPDRNLVMATAAGLKEIANKLENNNLN
jgi:hypothetical protein